MPSSVAKQAGTQGCQMACINLLNKKNTFAPIEVIYVIFFTTQKYTTTGRHFVLFCFFIFNKNFFKIQEFGITSKVFVSPSQIWPRESSKHRHNFRKKILSNSLISRNKIYIMLWLVFRGRLKRAWSSRVPTLCHPSTP